MTVLDPAAARQRRAYAYAWLTVCCWATVSTAFKFALAELHYAQLLLVCNARKLGWVGLCTAGFFPTMKSQLSQLP